MDTRRRRGAVLLAAALCFPPALLAAEPAPGTGPTPATSRVPVRGLASGLQLRVGTLDLASARKATPLPPNYANGFAATPHPLLDRISANVQGVARSWPLDQEFQPQVDSDTAKRGLIRATKKAVKRFLVEEIRTNRSEPPTAAAPPGSEAERAVRFSVGVSHLAPRLDMRTRLGTGNLNLSVGMLGQVGLDLDPAGLAQARIHVGYDRPSRSYAFSFRMGF